MFQGAYKGFMIKLCFTQSYPNGALVCLLTSVNGVERRFDLGMIAWSPAMQLSGIIEALCINIDGYKLQMRTILSTVLAFK